MCLSDTWDAVGSGRAGGRHCWRGTTGAVIPAGASD